ncbi:MAG TPA: hypothetical protein VF752_15475, partial [Thermoleophilaceae bacterium]
MSELIAADLALGGRVAPGWVEHDRGRVLGAAHGEPLRVPDLVLDGVVSAGLCDLQVNGAAGHEVADGEE